MLEDLLELRHRSAIKNQLKVGLLEQGLCLGRAASAAAVHNDFFIEFDPHLEQGSWKALERVIEGAVDRARGVLSLRSHVDNDGRVSRLLSEQNQLQLALRGWW